LTLNKCYKINILARWSYPAFRTWIYS